MPQPGKTAALSLASLVLAAAVTAAEPQPQGFVELFKAASAAHDSKDYARMEQLLRQALVQRPYHPTALYNLGAALALRGDGEHAMDMLLTLARMGLVFEPAKDEDFGSLKDSDRFQRIAEGFNANRTRVGHIDDHFELSGAEFVPEGLAFDDDEDDFFVGSVRERRIVRVHDGKEREFVPPGGGGLWAAMGMAVDAKRRLLWVATSAIPEMKDADPAELGRSGIMAFDLKTGQAKQRVLLPQDGAEHWLGDVLVLRDGTVYTTDSRAGVLYVLDPGKDQLRALTSPGQLISPQGMALSRDRRTLYIADYTQGLFRYEIKDRKLARLDVGREICVYGIDGLYAFDDELVAVQNGVQPHRVVQFELDRRGRRVAHARVLAANIPQFDEPTLGAVVHRGLFWFVANSHWNKFDKDHKLPADGKLSAPLILSLRLEHRRSEDRRLNDPQQQAPGQQTAPLNLPPVGVPRL